MPLLYYWRPDNYLRDLDMGAGYHLNQANPLLHQIDLGDSLWAFTRNRHGRYVLAAELVVKAKTENPPNFRYGRYRVWGDVNLSRYFEADNQPSVEQILSSLSCRTTARYLGQSFQGHAAVRRLSPSDHLILAVAARNLPLESRARILPEERLEAALLLGDEYAVQELLVTERPGIAEQRATYLYRQAPTRNARLVQDLQDLYGGRCQICLWHPIEHYGHPLCQGHHVHWLSRGGDDHLSNMVLICPNHHAAIHGVDAPLNYPDLTFEFGTHREPIQLNLHLMQ
jgi:5-methylcytosine-specific restriction enzyme A